MPLRMIAACLCCLVTGLVVGRLLPREPRVERHELAPIGGTDRSLSATTAAPARERGSRAGARPVADELGGDSSAGSAIDGVGEGTVLVPASLIGELSITGGARTMNQPIFSRDGKTEKLLGITDREKAAVQTAWRATRQRILELEAASFTDEDLEDGSVRITLPELGAERQALGERFGTSVRDALGGNRGEAFLALKQIDRLFAPAGQGKVYTLSPEAAGDGGWRFHMTLEGPFGRRVWVGESIPNELRHLTDAARIVPSLEQPPTD